MAQFDVVTIGGAVRDITFYTNEGKLFATPNNLTAQKMLAFEYGAKVRTTDSYYSLGGGAANAAIAFARLGFLTSALVRLGKDEDAHEIKCRFKDEKISTNLIQIDDNLHTGISFILAVNKKDREHVAFVSRGANNNLELSANKAAKLKTKLFYITSLSGTKWLSVLKAAFGVAKKTGSKTKIAWNPGSVQLQAGKKILSPLLKQTDILILNKDEAIELVLSGMKVGRRSPSFLNRPLYLLNILQEWGPKIVVITGSQKGAWVFDGKKVIHQKVKRNKIVDTTGVGDAFGSTFVAAMELTKGDIKKSLLWATTNAGSVCTKVGAQNGLLNLRQLKKKV